MTIAVAAEYIKKFTTKERAQKVHDFILEVQKGLTKTIKDNNWLDETIKVVLMDKFTNTKYIVSHPEELADENQVNSIYELLDLNIDQVPVEAYLELEKFNAKIKYGRLREDSKIRDWYDHANIFDTKVEYSEPNTLRVPAGVLVGHHYYADNRPIYLNFGGLGWLIGEQFAKSILTLAQQFRQVKKSGYDQFDTLISCLSYQYGDYAVFALQKRVDGERTLVRNFADNGGLNIAFNAYLKWFNDHGKENLIPGFHRFGGFKMFWIAAAASHCTAYTDRYLDNMLSTSPNAPAEFRVIGSVSNSKEFATDFRCRTKSPMNPKQKCDVF